MAAIKICGLTSLRDIEAVNCYRPDYIGFVFAESRRRVTKEQAALFKERLQPGIKAVGVFVNQDRDMILDLLQEGIIDTVQLHGQETEEEIVWLKNRSDNDVIKAVSVKSKEDIEKWQESLADFLLLDNGKGGTGERFDWGLVGTYKKPFFLAGGINEGNILEALTLNPYAVDVSGGVETGGVKDIEKIKRIVEIVRNN